MKAISRFVPVLVLVAVLVTVQIVVTALGMRFYLTQLTMGAYYSLVVLGLCLLMGYAGQISLGHAAFFAIGGYVSAALTTWNLHAREPTAAIRVLARVGLLIDSTDLYGRELLTLSPWIALAAALVVTIVLAYTIGVPVLRLKGHYLAMATLGFGVIVYHVVLGSAVFGEADGISQVPPFPLFPGLSVSGHMNHRISNYYIAWAMVVLLVVVLGNLFRSRMGRAIRAIHGDEEGARAMGIDTARLKVQLFVISAICAAVAGVFLTHYNGGIGPSEAGVMKSVRYVAIVSVGGMANYWGVLLWGVALNYFSLRGAFGSHDDAVFGLILVLVMMVAPQGIGKHPRVARLLQQIQHIARRCSRGAS